MIFGAEFLLATGILLVLISLAMLGVAERVRSWFFLPDLRAEIVKETRQTQPKVPSNLN
jgi:hypothetical protein